MNRPDLPVADPPSSGCGSRLSETSSGIVPSDVGRRCPVCSETILTVPVHRVVVVHVARFAAHARTGCSEVKTKWLRSAEAVVCAFEVFAARDRADVGRPAVDLLAGGRVPDVGRVRGVGVFGFFEQLAVFEDPVVPVDERRQARIGEDVLDATCPARRR